MKLLTFPIRHTTPGTSDAPNRRPGGFSLIELLVVISIASLLIAISFPFLRQMVRSSSETMAADSISNAVSAARAFSTRYKPFTDTLNNGKSSEDDGDGYSGAAVIVTPAGELRIVENFELATDQFNNRMELPSGTAFIRNGYAHIEDVDDLRMPGRAVALGIRRTGPDELELLPAPFAISFNRRGGMVVRSNVQGAGGFKRSDGYVYYDANGDGTFDYSETRAAAVAAGVDLTDFARGEAPRVTTSGLMEGRREIPFERLEPVIGVVIFVPSNLPDNIVADNVANEAYDPDRVDPYVIDTSNPADNNLLEWASETGAGVVMFFNRNTGADMNR